MQKKLKDKTELSLITKPVTASITTDASDAGIGFIINTEKRTDCMGKVRVVCLEKNTTSSAPEGHINWKEIEAVLKALEMHKEELGRKHFVWYSDSTTTLAAIRRQGTQKLSKAAWELTKSVSRPGRAEENNNSPKTRLWTSQLRGRRTFTPRRREKSSLEKTLEKITKEWGP